MKDVEASLVNDVMILNQQAMLDWSPSPFQLTPIEPNLSDSRFQINVKITPTSLDKQTKLGINDRHRLMESERSTVEKSNQK